LRFLKKCVVEVGNSGWWICKICHSGPQHTPIQINASNRASDAMRLNLRDGGRRLIGQLINDRSPARFRGIVDLWARIYGRTGDRHRGRGGRAV
jgi:hypothetical protein